MHIALLAEHGAGQSPPPPATQAIFALLIALLCLFTYRVWHGKRSDPFGNELTDAYDRKLFTASLPASIAGVGILVAGGLTESLGNMGGLGQAIVRTIVIIIAAIAAIFGLLILTVLLWRWPQLLVPPHLRSAARKRSVRFH
jgi:hypothetical protein